MPWVTVRLSEPRWGTLQHVCRQYGVTSRSLIECAAFRNHRDPRPAEETPPLTHRVGIRLDDEAFDRLKEISKDEDLTLNGLLAAAFRHPVEDRWWGTVAEHARVMDYNRRMGRRLPHTT